MASTSQVSRLCLLACRQSLRTSAAATRSKPVAWRVRASTRSFHSTATPLAKREEGGSELAETPWEYKRSKDVIYEDATPDDIKDMEEFAQQNNYLNADDMARQLGEADRLEEKELEDELKVIEFGERPSKMSLWYDEEDPMTNTDEDPFNEDDMTSMAHAKLDQIKEMRHYERLIVWEMPLLAKLAKPFEPPTEKQVLRWRYTTYMGDNHPSEKKVVVEFSPDDLGLTPVQASKLCKLAGARYNPETRIVRMASESFQHPAQNKAYLSGLVDDLVAAAKDPKDDFSDVPLDTRHHSFVKKPKFPKAWRMTEARKDQLHGVWHAAALEDARRSEEGTLVEGQKDIDAYLMARQRQELERQKEPELVEAPKRGGKSARGKAARW